jgi:hypothetical protein
MSNVAKLATNKGIIIQIEANEGRPEVVTEEMN